MSIDETEMARLRALFDVFMHGGEREDVKNSPGKLLAAMPALLDQLQSENDMAEVRRQMLCQTEAEVRELRAENASLKAEMARLVLATEPCFRNGCSYQPCDCNHGLGAAEKEPK